MNPNSGHKRGMSWDEPGPSWFGPPKRGRFDDMAGGALSRRSVQQNHSQGSQGFHEEPCSDYGHQDGGWSQGARGSRGGSGGRGYGGARGMGRGTGSTISRLMDMDKGTDGGSGFGGVGPGGARGMGRGTGSTISRLMDMDKDTDGGSGFGGGGYGGARGMGRGTGSTISRLMDMNKGTGGGSGSGGGGYGGARGIGRGTGSISRLMDMDKGTGSGSSFGGGDPGGPMGMGRGTGSTVSRLMDMAMGSGGGGSFAGSGNPSADSYSQGGDSSFVDYNGCNQHQQRDYGGSEGGGMCGQGFRGRGSSVGDFGHPRGAGRGIRPFGRGSAARGRGIGYEAAPQYGHFGGGFDIGGGYNQNQFSGDQRAEGQGRAGGEFVQHGSGRGGQSGHRGGDRGRGDAPRGSCKDIGSMVSRLMDLASSGDTGFVDSSNPSRGWGQGGDYGRGRGVGERGRGRGGHHGGEKVGGYGGFADSGNPSRGGGQGRGGDCGQGRGRGESSQRKGGHRSQEIAGHTTKVMTRPNGTTYYIRNDHSLLQNSSKFQEGQDQRAMLDRLLNLCEMAKPLLNHPPEMASITLEGLLLADNVCLTPGYAIKGERIDDLQPFKFQCKVYIDNIFIASGVAPNKKEAKNKACNAAIKVLGTKSAQIIITTHEKVNNVMELGKQDADIIECPFSSAESNIANILSVPESDVKKSRTDLYILEPEELDKSMGMKSTIMNSTCILRQSADFSHLLLTYEFTKSAQGFLCTVNLEGETLATGTATLQHTAKNLASHAALQNLRQTNWTIVIIKREKPKPATQPLTARCGRIRPNDPVSRQHFMDKLRANLGTYFAGLEDHTKWLTLSSKLNREENDAVYSIGKEMNLSVQARRLDGTKNPRMTANAPRFLVVSKKFLSQDLFDYIWEKGGETWRYRLKPPGEIATDIN